MHEVDRPLNGTCHWILQHPYYCTWRTRDKLSAFSNILSLKGKVGSGKSVLCKAISEHLQEEASSRVGTRVLHYFFNDKDPTSFAASQTGLLRSLLCQILEAEPSLLKHAVTAWQRKTNTYGHDWSWDLFDLKQLFHLAMSQTKAKEILVIIDAIDECTLADDLVEYLQSICGAYDSATREVRWLLSSRHYPVLAMERSLEISIDENNFRDIDSYVMERLDTKPPHPDFAELLSEISRRASGVFLWAVLVVKTLLKAKAERATPKEMMQILQTLPKKFDDLIHEIFLNIKQSEHADTACRIMQWVAFATRPLTAEELAWALAVGSEDGRRSHRDIEKSPSFTSADKIEHWVRARTQGLVEVRSDDINSSSDPSIPHKKLVQFIHGTIRQAIVTQQGFALIRDHFRESPVVESHHLLAMTCVTYLGLREFTLLKGKVPEALPLSHPEAEAYLRDLYKRHPLLEYAVDSTFNHISHVNYSQSLVLAPSSAAMKRVQNIFSLWSRLFDLSLQSRSLQIRGSDITFAHVAAEYDISSWLFELIDKGVDINSVAGARSASLLTTAAAAGHEPLAQKLILHGADVNVIGSRYGCALVAAAARGLFSLLNDLLEQGCNVDSDGGEYGTPLQATAFAPDSSIECLQLLLGANAEVNKIAGIRGTALQAAAFAGNLDMLDMLLDAGAQVNLVAGEHGCALQAAAYNGHAEAIDLLLAHEANPTMLGGSLGTASHAAACSGHRQIVQRLSEAAAEISNEGAAENLNAQVERAMTLGKLSMRLERAIQSNDPITVQSLLQHDLLSVNVRMPEFMTAFHAAAYDARDEIMALLLAAPVADPDVVDFLGRTPLLMAAAEGHLPIVKRLLDWDAAVRLKGERYLEGGRLGLDYKAKTDLGHNILWIPCARRQMKIVELLLPLGVDPYEVDVDGISSYEIADEECKKLIVQYRLQKVELSGEKTN